jgi:hypothetical protein
MEKRSLNPSLEKILISYSEFARLKSIEKEYQSLQNERKKLFDNSEGIYNINQTIIIIKHFILITKVCPIWLLYFSIFLIII